MYTIKASMKKCNGIFHGNDQDKIQLSLSALASQLVRKEPKI